jgi:nucleoside-diphosphate-sugar epimerase
MRVFITGGSGYIGRAVLSTFVMISQNRADAKRQVIANEQWSTVQEEDQQNKELLDLSRQILQLTKEVRAQAGRDGVRNP